MMQKEGLFDVKCVWVHENCFYWEVTEYVVKTRKGLFFNKVTKEKVARYEWADIPYVYKKANERHWKYEIFNVRISKTNL